MHVMAIRGSSLMNSAPANARKRTRPVLTFFPISRQGVFRARWSDRGNRAGAGTMKKLLIMAAMGGISFLPSVANAQERLGDGAMGALAGAVVGGPVGLVAGGVVGYTAGPSIASSWGASKGTGIIAMSIIAEIRRDNPALRGFA
jgi:hypothetical protein